LILNELRQPKRLRDEEIISATVFQPEFRGEMA
jgi:hypothetical protein